MHFPRSAAHLPQWLPASRTTAGQRLSERDVLRATRPGMDSARPGGNRQGCAPCRARRHAALTVRDVQDAWMVAALDGAHGQVFRADRNRRDALCRGRNADAVTSAYWA